jgi:lipoate-protein ligase A
VLTPSRAKLYSKGVKSVPSRVTTLRAQGIDISCEEFVKYALSYLCPDAKYVLTEKQLAEVEEIMQSYLTDDFLRYNEAIEFTHRIRIDGVGEIAFSSDGEYLTGLSLRGDFFQLADIHKELLPHLEGVKLDRQSLEQALQDIDTSKIIAGLTNEALIDALLVNKF